MAVAAAQLRLDDRLDLRPRQPRDLRLDEVIEAQAGELRRDDEVALDDARVAVGIEVR